MVAIHLELAAVSYDLDVIVSTRLPFDWTALASVVRDNTDLVARPTGGKGLAVDGAGFAVEVTSRGVRFSAGTDRGPHDEWAMEWCACVTAGRDGAVLDRHTGRSWTSSVLTSWLQIAPLLSGRALECNHERIARSQTPVALAQFRERVDRLVHACSVTPIDEALRRRIHDELASYTTRAQFTWIVARALGALGDLSALEYLTRNVPHDNDPNPFVVAASFGDAAAPLFSAALDDPDPNHRRAAARALHHLEGAQSLALVRRALEDRRATVREAVLEVDFDKVMARPEARTALTPTLVRLTNDPSSLVRKLVARWVDAKGK